MHFFNVMVDSNLQYRQLMIDIAAVQSGVATRPSQSPNPLSPRPPTHHSIVILPCLPLRPQYVHSHTHSLSSLPILFLLLLLYSVIPSSIVIVLVMQETTEIASNALAALRQRHNPHLSFAHLPGAMRREIATAATFIADTFLPRTTQL